MTYQPPDYDHTRPQPPVPTGPGPYPPAGYNQPLPILVQIPPTSGTATASMVLGILGVLGGWCLFGLPCILAVILGHVGLRETRHGTKSGRGMAVAGLVLGYVFVGPMILFTIMMSFGSV